MTDAKRIAAIDIGSNSIRIAVIDVDDTGAVTTVEEGESVQRLVREVSQSGRLGPRAIDSIMSTLHDFVQLARASEAHSIVPVATAAVREASDSAVLRERLAAELGLELQIASGDEEARITFLGAVHSVPIEHGIVLDIGGGSLELAHFRDRRLVETWTLPLGAVRMSDRFAHSDPPTEEELSAAHTYAFTQLRKSGIGTLAGDEQLIGTGGTVRNLARMQRGPGYPVPRLHGYTITRDRLHELARRVHGIPIAQRHSIAGLNPERADAIEMGSLLLDTVFEVLGADAAIVSGHGLREGIALTACSAGLPSVAAVRASSLRRTIRRFAPTRPDAGERRANIVHALCAAIPVAFDRDLSAALDAAARLLDIGRSANYYSRHKTAEALILGQGLPGYSHREVAIICALIRHTHQQKYDATAYRPLLSDEDRDAIAQASAVLRAAEEIEMRCTVTDSVDVRITRRDRVLIVQGPLTDGWHTDELRSRFTRTLGIDLVAESGEFSS